VDEGKIVKISGPLIVGDSMPGARMFDMVEVGSAKLLGEIIELHGDRVSIQVYEETSGIKIGEPIRSTGRPLSVELGPGLIGAIYDGIQRPLDAIRNMSGDFISRGFQIPRLDRDKKWAFSPSVKKGERISPGDILGEVAETKAIRHKIMAPPGAA
jgi:V/A-type H+/Na+-transporting ATPase subunit A